MNSRAQRNAAGYRSSRVAIMRVAERRRHAGGCATLGLLASVIISCGGVENTDRAGTGGTDGSGGKAVTGGSGGKTAASGGTLATGGSPGKTGGAPAIGTGGAPVVDAGSAGGESAVDGARDVCALHGAACCVPAIRDVKPETECVLDVFAEYLNVTYEYADLETKIASLSKDIAVSVTDADVKSAEADPPPARRIQLNLKPEASSRLGPMLVDLRMHPFRLSCGGQRLLVGVVYDEIGAAAIRTPVLHLEKKADGSVALRLGAWQGAWMGFPSFSDSAVQERLDRPELRAVLCEKGALRQLELDAGL